MLSELATVAAYSASASFGRDVYKSVKEKSYLVVLLAGCFLTVFGFRQMVMGHQRGFFGTLFLTVIGSLLMICFGTVLAVAVVVIGGAYTGLMDDTRGSLAVQISTVTAVYIAVSAVIGVSWGLSSRGTRKRLLEIQDENVRFLEENGFKESGLGEDIIEDADGNRLKLKAEETGRLVFMVVGKRNVRSAIELDEFGRMVAYSGAVRI